MLVRHGQTEWSRDGKHTGRTDIELTAQGRDEARVVAPTLEGWKFVKRYSSPLQRALETANLSGLSGEVIVDENLVEWDYGVYEGRRTVDITVEEPGWSKWHQPLEGRRKRWRRWRSGR